MLTSPFSVIVVFSPAVSTLNLLDCTAKFPATSVFPDSALTVNLFLPTARLPPTFSVPLTVTFPVMFVSLLMFTLLAFTCKTLLLDALVPLPTTNRSFFSVALNFPIATKFS